MPAIRFPRVEEPLVSVVMVTYGNWPLVRRSLEALLERTDPVYEVVIVDSASPDETPQRLREEVEGANIVLSDENLGFGGGSNLGAEKARGRYVCFLNSDAMVEPGWLDPLLEVLEEDATAGAAVPMLLNPNGSIQEAGSVIDSVGWTLALGAGESAEAFQHRFRREIDYGSGACMLVRREDFWTVEGFDPAYGIGYFEDVDLSFKLKEQGLRTMYEPRSRVVHELHGSGSSVQARRRMEANRAVFYRRWSERLSQRPNLVELPTNRPRLVAARDAEVVDRILVLDDRVPFHDRGSGDPRMAKLLFELVDMWPEARVTLAAADGSEAERYAEPLLARGIEVVAPPVDWKAWFENRMYHYSVAIISRGSNVTRFDGLLRVTQPQALRAFDTEALTFRRLERMVGFLEDSAAIARAKADATAVRQVELGALHDSAAVIAVSSEEADFIAEVAPGDADVRAPELDRAGSEPGGLPGAKRLALLRRLPRRRGLAERGRAPPSRGGRDADPLGARSRAAPQCRRCRSHARRRGAPVRPGERRRLRRGSRRVALAHPRPRQPDAVRLGDQAQAAGHDGRGPAVRDDRSSAPRASPSGRSARHSSPRSPPRSPSSFMRSTPTSSSGDGPSAACWTSRGTRSTGQRSGAPSRRR